MKKDNYNIEKLNFFNLTKKYWKDQLIFYILSTLSCLGSFLISENGIKAFIKRVKDKGSSNSLFFLGSEIMNFGDDKFSYVVYLTLFVITYFFIVFSHVLFSYYLQNKIRTHIKKVVSSKLFELQKNYDKKKISSLLTYNIRMFSESVFYVPNQIYYVFIDSILNLISLLRISQKELTNLGIYYFFLLLIVCSFLQFFFYKEELKFQESLENEIKKELFLIDSRDLIIKKNSSESFLNSYEKLLNKTFDKSNSRDFAQTLSFVVPSFLLIKLFPVLVINFVSNINIESCFMAVNNLVDFFDNFKKVIERAKSYPFCISSQSKINEFLKEEERNDVQNNIIFDENIEKISFKNVCFNYPGNGAEVLKNLNIDFNINDINRMDFPNGFGKSTIINILLGLLEGWSGDILINDIYDLKDLNLVEFRKKIAYSEHKNLICHENFSTGQKQIIDLDHLLDDRNKQIYIFDEADSNLDFKNRNNFLDKVKNLSKEKIVILVSHLSTKIN
jgi:ABC-type bacteriocin/lantibiotic exporter with double-glycine peptidase domain